MRRLLVGLGAGMLIIGASAFAIRDHSSSIDSTDSPQSQSEGVTVDDAGQSPESAAPASSSTGSDDKTSSGTVKIDTSSLNDVDKSLDDDLDSEVNDSL